MAHALDSVADLGWYHTIELPDGTTTPGLFDVRTVLDKVPLPASLEGKRCLDVATCDGFYAFEMEKRGAAEVHGVDLDDPADRDWPSDVRVEPKSAADYLRSKRTFAAAAEARGSKAIRHNLSIYDISPDVLGTFDFVIMGSVLLHLQDAVRALAAVRSVTAGQFLSIDTIDPWLSLTRPRTPAGRLYGEKTSRWWTPNAVAHRRWVEAAGFTIVDSGAPVWVGYGAATPKRPQLSQLRRPADLRFWLGNRYIGVPHQWILATP